MTSSLWQTVTFHSAASGSLSVTPAVTIPSGAGGKVARFCVVWNNDAVIANDPAGWTREPAGSLSMTALRSAMWKRTLVPSDDETALTVTFDIGVTSGVRCAGALVIFADGEDDQATTTSQTTTAANAQATPASATADASSLVVEVLGLAAATSTTITPQAGWTETANAWTTNASGQRIGVWVATRDTRVASGAASTAANATANESTARSNAYKFLISDSPTLPDISPGPGWQFGSLAMRTST
jgi:hypothetical protein